MPPSRPAPSASAATKEPNEYIPTYISKKPFYVTDDLTTTTSAANDYLEHQRLQKPLSDEPTWYDRGKRLGPAATKFRKGACTNCGALTHKLKDCLSRPRKTGAKWSGQDIQADEVIQDVELGWDAKRDRWNGYDTGEYKAVVEEYAQLEQLKHETKKATVNDDDLDEDDVDANEAKYAEESEMGRQQAKGTKGLRIREDTAKYLLNLDLDSAKYDPKTRSMVDGGVTADSAAELVAEDNFMRASGDAAEFEKAQRYAWEAQERGDKNKQHIQANPTSGEYFRKKELEERERKQEAHRKALLEKYGGTEYLKPATAGALSITENERYVEYDESGGIKGAVKRDKKSKYKEDVLINNHTSVWGSWWEKGRWGYRCCHSTVKNSYCTGEEGKRAFEEAANMRMGGGLLEGPPAGTEVDRVEGEDQGKRSGEDRGERKGPEEIVAKKRTLAEMKGEVDEEEMDAYRRKRAVADDPMAAFLGKDELVH